MFNQSTFFGVNIKKTRSRPYLAGQELSPAKVSIVQIQPNA